MNFFKNFIYEYDKKIILDFFEDQEREGYIQRQGPFVYANNKKELRKIIDNLSITIEGSKDWDFGLAKIIKPTGYHINPNNNGLLIFPIEKNLMIDFYRYQMIETDISLMGEKMPNNLKEKIKETFIHLEEIDNCFAFDGKVIHNLYPKNDYAIFFAFKIPSEIPWKKIYNLL